jgi:hypothetical protein
VTSNLIQKSLRKFRKVIESLDLDKRISAMKWLEGVIVAQSLTTDERDELVHASNKYIGSFEGEEYQDAVNALIGYFTVEKKKAITALAKKRSKCKTKKS